MQSNAELAAKIKQLESKYDEQFKVVFDAIRQLIKEEREERPIGFQRGKEWFVDSMMRWFGDVTNHVNQANQGVIWELANLRIWK